MSALGMASAQAAYEAPPDDPTVVTCPRCNGTGEITECAQDGSHGYSHTLDRTETCSTCDGTGEIDAPADDTDWCPKCGLDGTCPDCDVPGPHDNDDPWDGR